MFPDNTQPLTCRDVRSRKWIKFFLDISHCELLKLYIMFTDLSSEPIEGSDKQQFCVEMMKRLDIQRRNEQFCDVILEVGSGDYQARLKAHRVVLCAASPFFYNALNSDMKEKKEGVIRLEETSKAVMEEVLEYLYTGHVDINDQNAFDLLKIADYLIVPSLKELSRDTILQTLSPSNCFMAYYYSTMYLDSELDEIMIAQYFTFNNFVYAAESDDFLNLSVKQVEEWVSSDQIVVEEEEQVFQVIVKWMEKSENSKHQSFFQLFRHVRLVHVSRNYVFDVILPHPLVKSSKLCSEFVFDVMQEVSNGTEECYFAQPQRNCLQTHDNTIVVMEDKRSLCYIASEDKWYNFNSIRHALHDRNTSAAAMTTCQGKLYVVGGNDEGPAAECYDPLINSGNQGKSFNLKAISYAGVVCFQGHLYVIGGEANAKTRLNSVLKYNPDTDLWHSLSPLSSPRSSVCAVADSKSLYVIGGNSSIGHLNIVEKYDPDSDSWSKIPSTIQERSSACGAIVREKVFVFGGLASTAPSENFIEMYDPTANNWIRINSAIAPRGFSRAVSVKGQIFVLGCFEQDDSLEGVTSLWMYDVDENEWKPCSKPPCVLGKLGLLSLLRVPIG